jgi:4-amino-4-deoxy-L-arabinose transferase-like glycosyltransferase
MNIKPKYLIGIAVFLTSFTILLITVPDYGLTWDEPLYIDHSNKLQHWFGLLFQNQAPFSDEAVNSLVNYGRFHNCHPPFYKLSAILFQQLIGKYFFPNMLYQYRVSTTFWSAILIVLLYLYLYRAYKNHLIALLGAGIFFTVPRFFAHMHLFATDIIIVCLYFLALYFFVFGKKPISAICGGLFGGALLASKFTGILLLPILIVIVPCFRDRNEYSRRLTLFIPALVLSFILFDIHLWVGLGQEIAFYFRSALDREANIPIATLFFGRIYDFRLPWYQPLIMMGICIPFALVVFAILSPVFGGFNRCRKFWLFELLPLFFFLLIFSLPKTPKHDGIRLFSLAWPHLILLSIRGICGISQFINRFITDRVTPPESVAAVRLKSGLVTAVLLLTLTVNILALVKYHPYQLSYYNAAIGGTAGASKKGFTISYWYDALDRSFLTKLNAIAKDDQVLIYSFPNSNILKYNRALGLIEPGIKSASNLQEANYILVLNRIIKQRMSNYLKGKEAAITASTPQGVWILSLFEKNRKRRVQAVF